MPLCSPRSSKRIGPPGSERLAKSEFGCESLATRMSGRPSWSKSQMARFRPKPGMARRMPAGSLTSRKVPSPRFSYRRSARAVNPFGPGNTTMPLNCAGGGGDFGSNST